MGEVGRRGDECAEGGAGTVRRPRGPPLRLVDKRTENRRNVGCAVYAAPGTGTSLRNHARGRAYDFDLNAVMRLLVCERIPGPGSKWAAWERRGRHFLGCDLLLADACRGTGELAAARDKLCAQTSGAIAASGGRDASCACYDVTNYFFESGPDGQGGLRERSVPEERRPNPIARMGMLQDADGVPIPHELFCGNTQDGQAMMPVLAEMRRAQGVGRVVAVADKGPDSSDNIAALMGRGDGFVLSQSLRGTRSDGRTRAWATSDEGWDAAGDFRTRSRQGTRVPRPRAGDTADGRPKDVEAGVKWVALWSGRYQRRARAERARVIERARDPVAHYARHTHHGAARYVRNVGFDGDGSVATRRELSLDEEAIAWLVARFGTSNQQNLVPSVSKPGTAGKVVWYRRHRT
mgnify:FL=1